VPDAGTLLPTAPAVHRPEALFDPSTTVQGLRAAEARQSGGQRLLDVRLYHDPPAALADPALWTLTPAPGGAAVAVSAATVEAAPTPHVQLMLAGLPDTARYRLLIDPPAGVPFDPLRTWLPVRLRPECPDLGSCFAADPGEPAPPPSPLTDYTARDWRSLRRVLIEQLLREAPDADTSVADPTITLLELFAHIGDLLHYRLDRVATEAYLETARLRTSVRRHARLVDFELAEAVSATTVVHVAVAPGEAPVTVATGEVAADEPGSVIAFTLDAGLVAHDGLAEIPIYDWGEDGACLPAGATECVLVRPTPADPLGGAWLSPGDLIAFEVVHPGDHHAHARWAHRQQPWPVMAPPVDAVRAPLPSRTVQVVRLTGVEPFNDPLLGATLDLFRVTWARGDALARSYPVGIDPGEGADEVTVVRGNLVPAHHGRLVDGDAAGLKPIMRDDDAPPAEFSLLVAGTPSWPGRPGGPGIAMDADGVPYGLEVDVTLPSGLEVGASWATTLLDVAADVTDLAFVIDVEEHEPPLLRFQTGAVGLAPPLGSTVAARYEVGGGAAGNVAPNALPVLERNTALPGQRPEWEARPVTVRNPVGGTGGADRMPLDIARRDAPEAFAALPLRAVVTADHAAAAMRDADVRRAAARRTWTGSWPLITTAVDLDTADEDAARGVRAHVQERLDALRMLGTEAAVVPGMPVGLLIALEICATPGTDPEQLRLAVLRRLCPGTDARPGFFHPSNLELGAAVYLSAVIAAVAAVPGVDAVEPQEARRLGDPSGTIRDVITVGPAEVAVLDDDPAQPGRGRLDIVVRGGR
jgi:hypothetical protein